MRYLLFAVSILFLGSLAGCVWPPDSTATGYNPENFPYNAGFDVHRVSQRSIAGVESVVTTIAPYDETVYSPYNTDSIRYILVNGDTAYRHPILALPPVYDSAVPYHIDGSANFVTLIYSSVSIIDTSYENGLTAQITAPKYGDTIPRSTDLFVGFQASSSTNSNDENGYVLITDSALSYTQYTDNEYSGTLDFPSNDLESFQGNTLWADLHFSEIAADNIYTPNNYNNEYDIEREVDVDRIVAYPLH